MPTASRLRFDPPAVEMPRELRWVLLRAFGPEEARATPGLDSAQALEWARRCALAALIGSRHGLQTLAADVGSRCAAALVLEHEGARRAAEVLLGTLPVVGDAARDAGATVVLLKFAALTVGGYAAAGTRTAGDVDVLIDAEAIDRVWKGLLERGFVEAGFRESAHQLPMLRGAGGAKVELHRHIPGVRVPRDREAATVATLRGAGAIETASVTGREGPVECLVPARDVLVAHTIVHGIAQHRFQPQPLFRMLGDLVVLGATGRDVARAHRWVGDALSETEMRAAVALKERVASGEELLLAAGASASPEGVLLRHLVAAVCDDDYTRSLRLGWPGSSLSPRGLVDRGRAAWRAVVLTDAQIEVIYGRPRSRWGYLGRRIARPFDLVRRAARYARSRLRVRSRRARA